MADDDIRDLLGRYATGSLSAAEKARLFEAAAGDQELFDQLAGEHDIQRLLDAPGARARLIKALEPPHRRTGWIFGVAATAALSTALLVFLMRPAPPSSAQVAIAQPPPATSIPAPEPAPAPPAPPKVLPAAHVDQPRADAPPADKDKASAKDAAANVSENAASDRKEDLRKELDQLAAGAPPLPAGAPPLPAGAPPPPAVKKKAEPVRASSAVSQRFQAADQGAPGGPRQQQMSSLLKTENPFGFHYSVQTKGHLIVVPAGDGYLSVETGDGAVLFAPQRCAAGLVVDIAVPDNVKSLQVTFSVNESPPRITPSPTSDTEGAVQGATTVAVKINLQ